MRGLGIMVRAILAVLALLAALLMAGGALVAGVVGSDDTVFNRPAELGQDGRPVLTSPDLLAYDGIIVTLRASAPGGIFIGTAHPVDVADFVGSSSLIRLTDVTRTGVGSQDVGTSDPVRPSSAGFWTASMTGPGTEELTLDRDTSAAQWVIAPLSGAGPTTVSFGITLPGVYVASLVVAGLGALLLVVSVELLLRSRRRGRREPTAADRIAAFVPEEAAPAPARGRHTARHSALSVVLVLCLAGCTYEDLLPTERQSADLATTKVALTRAELPALFDSYDARVRRAIEAARPPAYRAGKWRLADGGPALESDLFGTRVSRLTRLGRRTPPSHDGVESFSGRFDSYPMWSMAASRVGRETRLDLFTKSSVEARWMRQGGSVVARDLPAPGRPSGLPDADAAAGVTAAWRDYLRTGEQDDRLDVDASSRQWRDNIADLGSRAMFRGHDVEVTAGGRDGLSRVVRVEDGMLAIVALRVTTRLDGRPDLMVRWAPPYGRYRPSRDGVLSFADVAVGIIHLPEKGTPRLLGSTFSEVAVRP